jgi:nicotinamidase/pyrazinamidase
VAGQPALTGEPVPAAPFVPAGSAGGPRDKESLPMRTVLLIVDVQPTFCEGGGLPVAGGNDVAGRIGAFVAAHGRDYAEVVASQDWHLDPGGHWAAAGQEPDYATTWPRHGVAGTAEAALHPAMLAAIDAGPEGAGIATVVRKGMHAAAYSAFEGVVVANDPGELEPAGPNLAEHLRERGIERLDVVGIATDHCDRMTVLDGLAAGFGVRLLEDLCVGVAPVTTASALEEMAAAGAEITTSAVAVAWASGAP